MEDVVQSEVTEEFARYPVLPGGQPVRWKIIERPDVLHVRLRRLVGAGEREVLLDDEDLVIEKH